MHDLSVLVTFAVGLAGALLFGYIAVRLKVSPIIGYLLAGIAVGPFTPGVVVNRGVAEQFAEIGVILLLFGIGLRFHLRELIAVWRIALPGALIQSAASTLALAAALRLFGWTWTSGLILGMAISVASTVVMALVLAEWHDLHARIGHIAIGWTVVEDILTVALLLLLPILFGPETGTKQNIGAVLGVAGLKIVGLVLVVLALGKWGIPWAMEQIARTRSRELFTLSVLVLAVGIAVSSAKFFGVSMALGAFLAGLAVGRSEFATRAANDALPMRDAFAVLFFVSVGMLFDPKSLIATPHIIGLVLLVVVVVKPIAATLTVQLLGEPWRRAIPIGAAFSQVGEFSFILGSVALGLGIINETGWNAMVAASIISIAANPYVYRWARGTATARSKTAPNANGAARRGIQPGRCILVGFGPVGRIVHQLLLDTGGEIIVVDLNLDAIREVRNTGHSAIYGDVRQPGTLVEAGVETTETLILSADVQDAPDIIKDALALNPDLRVLARCGHLRDAAALRAAGAEFVASGEAEVGVAMTEAVMAIRNEEGKENQVERLAIRRQLYQTVLLRLTSLPVPASLPQPFETRRCSRRRRS
ncbi:MAG TPA: cation:proton antiporter [Candidatus Kapabacteria bacterium]|nr:cation:proton antiporter [Candidatus Kapabacteria bacterium]